MQRHDRLHKLIQDSPEHAAPPLIQRLLALTVVGVMLIVVFSLLGERILELYLQTAVGMIF